MFSYIFNYFFTKEEEEVEKEIQGGLKVKINLKEGIASIVKSPNVSRNVLIPRFVEHKNKKYKIISIEKDAFNWKNIDSLAFPDDSEIKTFEKDCISYTHLKKLRIPPSLENLNDGWCDNIYDLNEITVSSKNSNFIYFNNQFLLGKTNIYSGEFDILYFARCNIENAVIPSHVKVIKSGSFKGHKNLKTITFPENSQLKIIESSFSYSSLEKLVLPASVETIDVFCFNNIYNLNEIEISPANSNFIIYEHKYLLKESKKGSKNFDFIIFAIRGIEIANIPPNIKEIGIYAFNNCTKLKAIIFEPNSSLKTIGSNAFENIAGPEKIVIPSSVETICYNAFSKNKNTEIIEINGKSIDIRYGCFREMANLSVISFPNAKRIDLNFSRNSKISKNTKIFVRQKSKLIYDKITNIQSQICYISEEEIQSSKAKIAPVIGIKKDEEKSKNRTKMDSNSKSKNINDKYIKENVLLKKFVSYLNRHLSKYEDTITFEEFKMNIKLYDSDESDLDEKEEESENDIENKILLFDEDDEKCQQVINKIAESSTSQIFRIIDHRTSQYLCKKVINETDDETKMRILHNTLKEIDFNNTVNHPCICKFIGCNLQEKLQIANDDDNNNDDDDEVMHQKNNKTTIALFFEYIPYTIKEIYEKGFLDNTLKVRISIDVAFGMSYIHSLGIIHRNFNIDNVMLNSVFDAKIINFGLVHIAEDEFNKSSNLTSKLGTLAFMSPEMINESTYSNKTDVYSYGIFLYVLFIGDLPKQNINDRLLKVPLDFPKNSNNLSEYCISLIKQCTSFEANQRPSFDEIINDISNHSFSLAPGIDTDIIISRYRSLNRIRSQKK